MIGDNCTSNTAWCIVLVRSRIHPTTSPQLLTPPTFRDCRQRVSSLLDTAPNHGRWQHMTQITISWCPRDVKACQYIKDDFCTRVDRLQHTKEKPLAAVEHRRSLRRCKYPRKVVPADDVTCKKPDWSEDGELGRTWKICRNWII